MAEARLHTSRNFFNEISTEAQRLRFIAQSQQVFIDRARVRAARVGDSKLLLDLDEVESFHLAFRESADRLENITDRMTRRML